MTKTKTALREAIKALRPALSTAFWISFFMNLTLFAIPLYSMQVYDRVLASRNHGTLVSLTMIVAVFLITYAILEYARTCILIRAGLRFNERISKPVYELAMRAELAGRSAAASQAIKDADTIRDGVSGSLVSALFDVPWTPVFVVICCFLHPMMGAVALGGALLISSCAVLNEIFTKAAISAAGLQAAETARFAACGLRNAETAKGLGMTGSVMAHWIRLQNATLGAQTGASEKAAIMSSATKVLRMAVQTALICTGAWLAIDRLISPGAMMAAMIIMGRALSPVEMMVANWKRIIAFRDAFRRLEDLFQAMPAPAAATRLPEARGDISVEGLVLRAPQSGAAIIKEVSFTVKAGTAVAVIGSSGGGKSSLIKALAGIWQPALGAVRIDGAAVGHWDAAQLGRTIGYLPQDVAFFPGTIAQNISRLGKTDDTAIVAAAKLAGVHEAILKLPSGYETRVGDGEIALSGGMRQRVALARAIYGNPRIVIMDEPNSNLDAEGEAALAESMKSLKAGGCTVIVVTHKPQLLAHADNVLIISAGRVQAYGKRDDVLQPAASKKIAPVESVPVSRGELRTEARAA